MEDLFDFTGKVAVITGGAGGIGKGIAVAFARHGASVAITSRDQKKLDAVAQEIRAAGGKALAVASDVTDENSVIAMVDRVMKEFSRIDILVNCAGAPLRKSTIETTVEEWKQILDVNQMGTFICCKTVGKILVKQNSGKVINISSIRGRHGVRAGAPAYCTSKGGVDAMTRTMAVEWGPNNINVNALAPNNIQTELTKDLFKDPARAKQMTAGIPLGRICQVEDVAGAALFLASNAASYISGQIIYIDGGTDAA